MRDKNIGFAILILVIGLCFSQESTSLASDRAKGQGPLIAALHANISAAVVNVAARPGSLLAAAVQNAKQNGNTRLSPRAWGKIIKVGVICLILVGGGAVWLFNKLKPQ